MKEFNMKMMKFKNVFVQIKSVFDLSNLHFYFLLYFTYLFLKELTIKESENDQNR